MYLNYIDEDRFYVSNNSFDYSIEIDDEVSGILLSRSYSIINKTNERLTLNNYLNYFEEIKEELPNNEISDSPDVTKSLAKQVGLLTLENKKKDVQIESLMKAVKALTNK
ncbi:MAG: hypothetical protein ACRCVJ_12475 [Clostridium sp.]|uniref:hypothetical protein n=1 Tax=Clostridium sp. TaxID=1506 RepID=UPI003F2D2204